MIPEVQNAFFANFAQVLTEFQRMTVNYKKKFPKRCFGELYISNIYNKVIE